MHGYVLSDFAKADKAWLDPLLEAVADHIAASRQGRGGVIPEQGASGAQSGAGEAAKEGRKLMGFKCGIVGLPNVGKSTLFNALTQTAAAQAANYPFCTIEPNVGDVAVPDRASTCWRRSQVRQQIIPTRLTFVDIAGLVRGASQG